MYVGRFLVVAPGVAGYRVSSRSFPNRRVRDRDGHLTVGPTPDAPETDNPYVAYNCLRPVERAGRPLVAVGNGSHVDPVAEKLGMGYPPRDALALALLALDFEKDDYDTPRIAGVVGQEEAFVATVRRDALRVERVTEPTLVATYERDDPGPYDLDATDADGLARELYEAPFEHAVCAAAATVGRGSTTADGWPAEVNVGHYNGP
jgi:IMP cyclohydrolase